MRETPVVTDIHPYDLYDIINNLDDKSYVKVNTESSIVEIITTYRQTSFAPVSPTCSLKLDPRWEKELSKGCL